MKDKKLPPLPVPVKNIYDNDSYILTDFVSKSDEYIKNTHRHHILVNYEMLNNHFDLLKHILEITDNNFKTIICMDYKSAIFLENNLDSSIDIALIDDYKNKDRSYINTDHFEKCKIILPLAYTMWNPFIKDECNVRCFRLNDPIYMGSDNGNTSISKNTLLKIKEIVEKINTSNLTDEDKCLIVSDYLQSKVQFIEYQNADDFRKSKDYTECDGYKYFVMAPKEAVTREVVSSVESVVNNNYGICMAIANTTTLLLNNPIMDVNARSLYGQSHVWNIININGKKYYIDNTWNITRNPSKVEEALKATDFTDKYTLLGQDSIDKLSNHKTDCYIEGEVEKEDYPREILKNKEKRLVLGNYDSKLAYPSRRYKI